MFRTRKVSFLFRVIFLALLLFATSTSANEIQWEAGALTPPPPIEASENGEFDDFFSLSSTLISNAFSSISRNENIVRVSGDTYTNRVVDELRLTLSIQRWDGTKWNTIGTRGPFIDYNWYYTSASQNYSVTRGYYYRALTIHFVKAGSTTQQVTRYSSHILVPL